MSRDHHRFAPVFSASSEARSHFWQVGFFLFLIALLAIPILQPLFTSQLTCGFDTVFHLWRAVQAGALLEEGVLFSQWAPHMAHGYGYPLFMYQSPLSAQVTAVFHTLSLSWPTALNLTYALGIVASGWTMWWLARTFWGDWGGLIAAVAYLYAPFHAYIAFYRASLSETVAWSLPPLVLWGLYRWQKDRTAWGLGTAVFSFILLVYTHDVTAYMFLPLFVGWIGLWAVGFFDRLNAGRSWPTFWQGGLALLLGLGGSAFFWLPAIFERSAIQFGRANSAWPFLYTNNFLPLGQLLALPRNADPSLLNDWPPRALGVLLLVVALAGAGLAWRRARDKRWLVGFLLLGLGGYLFLTVRGSEWLWTAVPQLAAFQFPWRFLAPASLIAAFLCGGINGTWQTKTAAAVRADVAYNKKKLRVLCALCGKFIGDCPVGGGALGLALPGFVRSARRSFAGGVSGLGSGHADAGQHGQRRAAATRCENRARFGQPARLVSQAGPHHAAQQCHDPFDQLPATHRQY